MQEAGYVLLIHRPRQPPASIVSAFEIERIKMKKPQFLKNLTPLIIIVALCALCVTGQPAFAAQDESGGGWRPVYDAVMLCVNFAILVFILIKLLKNPLKEFFKTRRETIADEIGQLEQEKKKTEASLAEVEKLVAAGDAHIRTIKKKLEEEGERIKEKIIENSRQESEYMLTAARKKLNNQFLEARKKFQAELVEMAMSLASEKMVSQIDKNDHEKLVNQFLYDLEETR